MSRPDLNRQDSSGRILRSTGAAAVSQLWRVVVTFGMSLVLRRLIPEADWGLWDWSFAVFMILGATRDLGLAAHIMRLKPRPFGNLLRVEAAWGGLLAAAAFLGAPILAQLFHEGDPRLVTVIRAMSLFLVLEGLAHVPLTYFEGELQIGRSLLPEVLRNLVFAAVAGILAWLGHGIWSLVAGQLAASAVFAALLWTRARGRIPLTHLPGQSLRLMWESLPLGAVWLVMLGMRHVDALVLGGHFDAETVGTYGFAYWIAFLVATLLIHPVGRSLYPALVGFDDGDLARPFDAYRLATLALLAVEVPAAFFLFLNADQVVMLLGGEKWAGSPAILRILCFAPLVDPLGRFAGQFLAARHEEKTWIAAGGVTLLSWATAGLLLTGWLGPQGMAWANYLPLGAVVSSWALYRCDPPRCRRLLKNLAALYLIPVPAFGAALLLPSGWPRFAGSLLAATVVLGVYVLCFGHQFRTFFRRPEPLSDLASSVDKTVSARREL